MAKRDAWFAKKGAIVWFLLSMPLEDYFGMVCFSMSPKEAANIAPLFRSLC